MSPEERQAAVRHLDSCPRCREVLAEQTVASGARRRHVSAVVGGALRLMPLSEVLYFQADQGYVSAVSQHSQLLIEDPLRALEEEDYKALPPAVYTRGFVIELAKTLRPDQSVLVNLSGRGDKDIGTVADLSNGEFFCRPSCTGQTVKGNEALAPVSAALAAIKVVA